MARFDVHQGGGRLGMVIDCQADTLRHLNSRFVVPLQRPSAAPIQGRKLNPRFEVEGVEYVMVTQFAGAVAARELGPRVVSLAEHDYRITAALDMLISGI